MEYIDQELIEAIDQPETQERQTEKAPKIDLNALAREIIKLLKEDLRRENERRGRPNIVE